jgi:hypothetical protein
MGVPATVYQGTTFQAELNCPKYSNTIYTGKLLLTRTGEDDIEIVGTSGSSQWQYLFTATATETADWTAGSWNWSFIVTDGTDVFVSATGSILVEEINGKQSELDAAKASLVEVRAALAVASGQSTSYNIKDRSLTRRSVEDLLRLESYWLRRVQELEIDAACKLKRGNRRITYATFTR